MKEQVQRIVEGYFNNPKNTSHSIIAKQAKNLVRVIAEFENYMQCTNIDNDDINLLETAMLDGTYKFIATNDNIRYAIKQSIQLFNDHGKVLFDLNWMDVSNVTDMHGLFSGYEFLRTLNISKWDVSNVTNMESMFYGSSNFKGCDFSSWDVSNVTNMEYMFKECDAFTGSGLYKWDVSNVTSMSYMFWSCCAYEEDLSGWNVGNVTNHKAMFTWCPAKQPSMWA